MSYGSRGYGGGRRRCRPVQSRPHARERTVAVDELMDERHRSVAERDDEERPEQVFVSVARELLQRRIGRDDVRNLEQAEPVQRTQSANRVVPPARQRYEKQQHIQQRVSGARTDELPFGHAVRLGGARIECTPGEAQHGKREYRDADRLVEGVDRNDAGLLRQTDHDEADRALHDDQKHDGPVKELRQTTPALCVAFQHFNAPSHRIFARPPHVELALAHRYRASPRLRCAGRPRRRCREDICSCRSRIVSGMPLRRIPLST